jgi:2-furoyl-CoA dehydrogenase large subunit
MDDPAPSAGSVAAAIPASESPANLKGGKAKALSARGEILLPATPEAVFAVLLDPVALARVIPGCNALESVGPNRYRADVTVGVGMIKARYAAEIALSEIEAPRRLRLAGSGLSSMGTAKGSGLVSLAPNDGGTLLRYDYEAEVSGKVAAVGGRMLEGAAKIVLKQLFEQLGRQAGGQGTVAVADPWWRRLLRMLGGAK